MSDRTDDLAKKVEQANNYLLRAIENSTDEQWRAKCADGEWAQGFAGYHAAASRRHHRHAARARPRREAAADDDGRRRPAKRWPAQRA